MNTTSKVVTNINSGGIMSINHTNRWINIEDKIVIRIE